MDGAKGKCGEGKGREVTGGIADKEMDHLEPIHHCEDFSFYSEGRESHRCMDRFIC